MIDLSASREIQRSGYRASGMPDVRVRCGPSHKAVRGGVTGASGPGALCGAGWWGLVAPFPAPSKGAPLDNAREWGGRWGWRPSGRESEATAAGWGCRSAVRKLLVLPKRRRTPVGVRSACPEVRRPFLPPPLMAKPVPGGVATATGARLKGVGRPFDTYSPFDRRPVDPSRSYSVSRAPPTSCSPPRPTRASRRPSPRWRSSPRPSGCRRRCPSRPRRSARRPNRPISGPCPPVRPR